MSASVRSFRLLIDTFSDIGTAVRASREYSRLSIAATTPGSHRDTISALLPR